MAAVSWDGQAASELSLLTGQGRHGTCLSEAIYTNDVPSISQHTGSMKDI